MSRDPLRDVAWPSRPGATSGRPRGRDSADRNARTSEPPLRAALTNLRHLIDSDAGLTDGGTLEILGLLRSIEISLLAREIRGSMPAARPQATTEPADSWLTPDEVAARLKRTRAWVYRQARRWPFAKRPSRKTLLISEHGLGRWMERR